VLVHGQGFGALSACVGVTAGKRAAVVTLGGGRVAAVDAAFYLLVEILNSRYAAL
jgi:hypothetical protein